MAVLAVFLGGLGGGALVAGRFSHRVRHPIRIYALLELVIAVSALTVPWAIRAAERLYVLGFGSQDLVPEAGGWTTGLFRLAATAAILALPTACMGATLPLLTRFAVRTDREIGSATGLLYAINTAGAVLGAPLTGFVLLASLGLRRTVLVAVGLNLIAAGLAWAISRRRSGEEQSAPEEPPTLDNLVASRNVARVLVVLVALSGAVSLLYEVLWTRLLAHLLGGSIYSFSTMLASFLAGIALGSALASRFAVSPERSAVGFSLAQLGIAGFTAGSFLLLDHLPLEIVLAGGPGQPGWRGPLLAILALLPGALCIGATFPFAVRVLARRAADAGPASARIYAWSTFGSVAGAIVAGLVLLPVAGFAGAIAIGIGTNLLLAGVSAVALGRPRVSLAVLAASALVALALAPPSTPWRILRSGPLASAPIAGRVVHQAVGRSATVLLTENEGLWQLTTNGLPEGTIRPPGMPVGRYQVTGWLGSLAVFARPETRSMLVVGLGAAELLEVVPSSVETVEVVEIEPEVVAANRAVGAERRRDPLSDPRVRVVINDARGALLLSRKPFDAIVSQPSHPWTSGSAHLYTGEFFALVRDHLSPGGVFVQWVGLPFVDEPLLRSVLATVCDIFPYVRVYRPPTGAALLFLASERPFAMSTTVPTALEGRAIPAELGIARPEDLSAALVLDESGSRALGRGARLITDDRNVLEARSPLVLGRALGHDLGEALLAPLDPLAGDAAPDLDTVYLVRRLLATRSGARARRLVEALPDSAARQAGLAALTAAAGRIELAQSLLRDSLSRDPASPEARALSLQLDGRRLTAGGDPDPRLLPLEPIESAVVAGWRAAAVDSWESVRDLEDGLGSARAGAPLFAAAVRLRAAWRLEGGDAAAAGEAIDLIDPLLARVREPEDLLLRARAAAAVGDSRSTLATLSELADRIALHPRRAELARRALELESAIPSVGSLEEWRASVRGRLSANAHVQSRAPHLVGKTPYNDF